MLESNKGTFIYKAVKQKHKKSIVLYKSAMDFFFKERVWLIDKKCTVTSHINDDYAYKSMCSFNNLF